ncbi:Uncharacterised protein [Mycobacteroides abscessus subsp. abscessus]|nr:Uncharacterised protein [Mycobacteroides abscessus subsp. abscessus]SKY69368.1 Uncharacterised protein [Mycobacteroides abscessus subsp. abscessus]
MGDLALETCGALGGRLRRARSGSAPDDSGERHAALLGRHQHLAQQFRIRFAIQRDAARHLGGELIESRDQPGANRCRRLLALTRDRRHRNLVPAKGVQQPGGVTPEPAQQCLARCTFDGELTNPAQVTAIPIQVVEIEDLRLAIQRALMPARTAVEAPGHLLLQRHLSVPQRQEQVVDALLGSEQGGERREGDTGAQVHQDRVHRLGAQLLGQLFAHEDVADGLTLAEPQRLQRAGPGWAPGQFQIGEDLEELHRTHALHPFDGGIDRLGRLSSLRCRLGVVPDTGDHRAFGVQRPVDVAFTVGTAVHLELRTTAVLQRMQRQLYLPRALLRQDDRLVEEHILSPCGSADGSQGHRGVGRTRNDDGAVDDVIGQPWLRAHRQPADVHRIAGGEILAPAQNARGQTAAALDGSTGRLRPEAAALERIRRQLDRSAWVALQRGEIGPMTADVGRGESVGDLTPVLNTLAQRDDRPGRCQMLGPDLHGGARQHRLRADLHQHRAPQRSHRAHALRELHRLTGVPPPVLAVDRGLRRQYGTRAVADQRQRRRRELHLCRVRLEFIEDRVQQLRMEGMAGL